MGPTWPALIRCRTVHRGHPSGGASLPIADTSGYTTKSVTLNGAIANPVKSLEWPTYTAAYASGDGGTAYPKFVMMSDGTFIAGSGATDPTLNQPYLQAIYQGTRFVYIFQTGDSINSSIVTVSNISGSAYYTAYNSGLSTLYGTLAEISGGGGYSTNGWLGVEIHDSNSIEIYVTGGNQAVSYITIGNIIQTSYTGIGAVNKLAFFGVAPVLQQVSGGTLAGVIAGLVALGLFSS